MSSTNGMHTKTDNIIVCKFKGVVTLLVKLNNKDILTLYPRVGLILDANLKNYDYLKLLHSKAIEPIRSYINSIKQILSNGYTSRVVGLCKDIETDSKYKLHISKIYVKCLFDVDTDIYNTLLVLDGYILKEYLLGVSAKGIIQDFGCKLNKDGYVYKYEDICNNILGYDIFISNISVKDYIVPKLQGCYIGKKGENLGYHFTNLNYAELDNIEYDSITDDREYRCGNRKFNFIDTYTFDSLMECNADKELVDDLFSSINNVIILADLIYVINKYNNKNLNFKYSFMLALLGLQDYVKCKQN